MIISDLKLKKFRNIADMKIKPCESVNIIYGKNAQGKTNLLESIWLFSGQRPFRNCKDAEMIKFDESFFINEISFSSFGREQTAKYVVDKKKTVFLNGIRLDSIKKLTENFPAVVFSPSHMSLIKDGPAERRRFLDSSLIQIKPGFSNILSKYNRNVQQRNLILKDYKAHPDVLGMLEIFEDNIAKIGAKIVFQRLVYTDYLAKSAREIYKGISSGAEGFNIMYNPSFEVEDIDEKSLEKSIRIALIKNRKEDILNCVTSVGPHRDDIEILLDGVSARRFGSQGQQRSCVLALKLGETAVLEKQTGEKPVILLDDVMSELDEKRQDYILHHLDNYQVFITCCDPTPLLKLKKGKAFFIENGTSEEKDVSSFG